jgi:hypothetical protein
MDSKSVVREWFRQPSSWLAIVSAIVAVAGATFSFATWYFLNLYEGKVAVLLPYGRSAVGIGISNESRDLTFILPLTLSNTGAKGTRHFVRYITAIVRSEDEAAPFSGTAEWTYEDKLVARAEYLKEFPKVFDTRQHDYVVYVGRAMPFFLGGGESTTKITELDLADTHPKTIPSAFSLSLVLHTDKGDVLAPPSMYQCRKEAFKTDQIEYCRSVGEPRP